ncbi:MAG: hypothetical protein R2780_13975 [Crocinitomicaceae bacterium]
MKNFILFILIIIAGNLNAQQDALCRVIKGLKNELTKYSHL